eukprot:SAG31_NODE_372_length_16598_cov_44.705982_7_plen_87_part_00
MTAVCFRSVLANAISSALRKNDVIITSRCVRSNALLAIYYQEFHRGSMNFSGIVQSLRAAIHLELNILPSMTTLEMSLGFYAELKA